MAEEAPEHQDRGMFGLFGKKKEEEEKKGDYTGQTPHAQTEAGSYYPAAPQHGVQQGQGHSHEEQQKQTGLKGKPHRTHSSSSSSSSDDEKEGGKKKEGGRKKKGSKEKSKERLPVGGQQYSDEYGSKEPKKTGLVDKIKEKIPGHQEKLPGEGKQYSSDQRGGEEEKREGLLDKIKDKLPGHRDKNGAEEKKEKKHSR